MIEPRPVFDFKTGALDALSARWRAEKFENGESAAMLVDVALHVATYAYRAIARPSTGAWH